MNGCDCTRRNRQKQATNTLSRCFPARTSVGGVLVWQKQVSSLGQDVLNGGGGILPT